MSDDIPDEVRRARQSYGERFGFDLEGIFRDLTERERESGREYVSPPPRRIVPTADLPLVDPVEAIPAIDPDPTASRAS